MVDYAFGIIASRFRVLLTTMEQPPEMVRDVVLTCVVVHNILRSQYNGEYCGQQPENVEVLDDGQLVVVMVVMTETLPEKANVRGTT